jgi:hypothetical protein
MCHSCHTTINMRREDEKEKKREDGVAKRQNMKQMPKK